MTGKVFWFQGVWSDILSFNMWLCRPWKSMGNLTWCVSVLEETLENDRIFSLIVKNVIHQISVMETDVFAKIILSAPCKAWTWVGLLGETWKGGGGVTFWIVLGRELVELVVIDTDSVVTWFKCPLWLLLFTRKVPWLLMDDLGVVRTKCVGLLCPNSMLVTSGMTCLPISTNIGLGPCNTS